MNELKIQSLVNSINRQVSSVVKSSVTSADFKSMLDDEIDSKPTKTYTQEEIDNFKSVKELFGDGITLKFPPDDAPVEFKAIFNDVCSRMDSDTFGLFSSDILSILENGVSYPIEYPEPDIRYSAATARINRLGYAGCIEFALQTQKRHVAHQGGNEQRFIDKMQNTVDALQDIMDKLKELDDPTINNQITFADGEYEMLAAKDDRDGVELAAAMATGMSNEEFQAVMNRIAQRQMRVMADGTILTTIMRDGHIINSFRQRLHNNKTLTI